MTAVVPVDADRGLRAIGRFPGYPTLAIGSLLWHASRWGSLYATTLLLTREGASPLHIQLVGALFFCPMLLGTVLARFFNTIATPRTIVLVMQLILVPVQLAMFAVVTADAGRTWVTASFMVVVGVGNTVNMTSQRLMIHDRVGEALAPTALAVEPLMSGIGNMLGAFGAGVLVDWYGDASSFLVLGALGAVCVLLTLRIPQGGARHPTLSHTARSSLRAVFASHHNLAILIAVTIAMNLFVFGFTTLVPKIAESFTSSAATLGLLASATGLGQLVGGAVMAAAPVRRRSLALVVGSGVAVGGVVMFTLSHVPIVSFAALFVAGIGQATFGAMQSVITIEPPEPAVRSASLGIVTTAVGANPLGMVLLGGFAQAVGARGGVLLAAALGGAMLAGISIAWHRTWLPPHN